MVNSKIFFSNFILLIFIQTVNAQKLKFLIPDAVITQYAGSIGFMSAGVSYDLFKNKRGSLDFMYGYLPESKGGSFSVVATKFAYRPIKLVANNWLTIYPLYPGTFLNYTVNEGFDLTWDREQYPKGYYYWSEALRLHLSIGNEFKFNTAKLLAAKKIKSVSLFYEINTNDVYLINYVQNKKYYSITDIFKAGIGLKAAF